jgi:hypothetical protein
MPRRCSGSFSEETIRQIRKQQSGYVPVLMGICEKCGRNVVAENKGGQWVPASHEPLPGRRGGGGKRTGNKR